MTTETRLALVLSALASLAAACTPMNVHDGDANPDADASSGPQGPLGVYAGPVDTEVEIRIGTQSVTAAIHASDVPEAMRPARYSTTRFAFGDALDPATMYSVEASTTQPGLACRVYAGANGDGATLMIPGAIRVGCEWQYDYLSRSTDDMRWPEVSAVRIGGANERIGTTDGLGEGRYVVFTANTGHPQVYWRDRFTGTTRLVSHDASGAEGNAGSNDPDISADGQWVIFTSSATNLVANDTNGNVDAFLWSAADGHVERVSVGPSGEQADGDTSSPSISGDGRFIAFASWATTITPPETSDNTAVRKIIRIDRMTNTRTVASRARTSGYVTSAALPMLSDDGQRIVFESNREIVGDINDNAWDDFVYDFASQMTWPITLAATSGLPHNGAGDCAGGCGAVAISGDGRWATIADASTNIVDGFGDGHLHYYLVEIDACRPGTGSCHVVPVDIAAEGSPADAPSASAPAMLTYDGRYVSFASAATNLGVTGGMQNNVYVFDRMTSRVTPFTRITASSRGAAEYTDISRTGVYVVFRADEHLDARIDDRGAFAAFTSLADAPFWSRAPLM